MMRINILSRNVGSVELMVMRERLYLLKLNLELLLSPRHKSYIKAKNAPDEHVGTQNPGYSIQTRLQQKLPLGQRFCELSRHIFFLKKENVK